MSAARAVTLVRDDATPSPRVPPASFRDIGLAAFALSRLVGAVTGEGSNASVDVLARTRRVFLSWVPFALTVLPGSGLKAADRELVTLRTGWNARSDHIFGHHAVLSRLGRLSADDVAVPSDRTVATNR